MMLFSWTPVSSIPHRDFKRWEAIWTKKGEEGGDTVVVALVDILCSQLVIRQRFLHHVVDS
jgi:hypothetical protein